MPELEDQLASLSTAIDWPPTPRFDVPTGGDLAAGVRRRRITVRDTRWALAAAAVLVIVATLLAYTPTRVVIAGWLNLHTVITRTQHLPTPSQRPSGTAGAGLQLGDQTTLAGAQGQVDWTVIVPPSLGSPDTVYVKRPPSGPSGGMVTLVYARRAGIPVTGATGVSVLVTEARGQVNEIFFQKFVANQGTVVQVTVNGHAGYWISGQPHEFAFTAADGTVYVDTLRLATNTLIVDDAGTLIRIEGEMPEQQAIEIARSMT